MRGLALLLALAMPAAGATEEIVMGLSADEVAITATFDGSDILIFGAVKREGTRPGAAPLDVIVTVSGPLTPVTVREKERVLGLWINTRSIEVDAAPSFYAVASTGPLEAILSETEDLRQQITVARAIRSVGHQIAGSEAFVEALIRIRSEDGLYRLLEGGVSFSEETLFHTSLRLPANLIEGAYGTRIFLMRDGEVVDRYQTVIDVRKVGLERWLFNLSREEPFTYGLLALALAAALGWAASAGFRALLR